MPPPVDPAAIVRIIADAALGTPWTVAAIAARIDAVVVMGGRRRREGLALAIYRLGPLFSMPARHFVRAIDEFVARLARAKAPLRPRARPRRVPRPPLLPGLPVLADLLALAAFLGVRQASLPGLADLDGRGARAMEERHRHYRVRWLPKPGGARALEIPKPRRKRAQQRILREILDKVPMHPAAHGFVRGRDVGSAAAPHVGARVLLTVDLRDFFGSIRRSRVASIFARLGYPYVVALYLAGICCGRLVDPRAPRLSAWHLPQGAPTSPALANLAAARLDRRLAGLAAALGLVYTRYADDLSFSGAIGPGVIDKVATIVRDEGFMVHPDKTRVRRADARQEVCGLVVNAHAQPPRVEYDRLRAILHNARATGLEAQNHEGHPAFRQALEGRVGWMERWSPTRGRRLRAMLDALSEGPDDGPPTARALHR